MKKLYISILLLFTLASCNDNSMTEGFTEKIDYNIKDILNETSMDTVFYHTKSDKIIGRIQKIGYHGNNIYLIDSSANQVMAFTQEGYFKEYVGRTGRGPGEYLKPVSFDIYGDNMVLVDQNLFQVSHYKYNHNVEEFQFHKSANLDISMSDICEANGNIWVYGYKDGNIIHKLSSDLERIKLSAGELTKYDQDVVRIIVNEGFIACSDEYIYAGITLDNTLYIHDAKDGKLVDKITFDNLVPVLISLVVLDGREAISHQSFTGNAYNENGNFHDILRNLIVVNDKIIAQYNRSYQNSDSKLISYIIDLNNLTYKSFYNYPFIHDFKNGTYLTTINHDSLSYIVNRVK